MVIARPITPFATIAAQLQSSTFALITPGTYARPSSKQATNKTWNKVNHLISHLKPQKYLSINNPLIDRQKGTPLALAAKLNLQQVVEKLFDPIKTIQTHKTIILAECRNVWDLPRTVTLITGKFKPLPNTI